MSAEILPSPEIWHRNDMSLLCNWRVLYRAVEVGVDRGEFARVFLDRWLGTEYYGVDSYEPYPEMPHGRDGDLAMAAHQLAPHASRAKLIRGESVEVAHAWTLGPVDFVYLDGAHDYESVQADIAAWFPLLSDKGILAGHDWTDQPIHEGVKRAVSEFAAEIGQTVYLTSVEGYYPEACPSWYLYRSGMPGPNWRRC